MELVDISEKIKDANKRGGHANYYTDHMFWNQACYSSMTYGKLKYFSAVLLNNVNLYDEEYTSWLISESGMKRAFLVHTLEEADRYGFVMNPEAPGNYINAAFQLLRMQNEFTLGDRLRLLRSYGASNAESIAMLNLINITDGEIQIRYSGNNHFPLRSFGRVDLFLKGKVLNPGKIYKDRSVKEITSSYKCFNEGDVYSEFGNNSEDSIYEGIDVSLANRRVGFGTKIKVPKNCTKDIPRFIDRFRDIYDKDADDGVVVE